MNHRVRKRTQKLDLSDQPETESEDAGGVDWFRLPDDVLIKVFTFLSYRDRAKLSSSCTTWRSLGSSSGLWQSLDLRAHKIQRGLMNLLSSRCSSLKKLRINGCDTMDSLSNLRAKALRDLRVDYCQMITDSNLSHIVAHHTLLESIELGPTPCDNITSEGIVAIALGCPKVKKLRLLGVSHINTAAITALATHCPIIQEIGFINCPSIDGAAALGNIVSLRFLSVAGATSLDWDLASKSWCKLPHLEGLDVSRTDVAPGAVMRLIMSLQRLKLLCAFECPSLELVADLHTKAKRLGITMLGYFNDTFKELSSIFPGTLSEWRNQKDGILDEFLTWIEWILSHVFLSIAGIRPRGFEAFWVNQGIDLLLNLLKSSQEDVQEYAAIGLGNFTVVVNNVARVDAVIVEAIMKGGGVELLLGLATSLTEEIQYKATKTISNLLVDPAFAMSVVGRGGISILARLTKSKHLWVAKEAAGGLRNLSVYDEYKGEIADTGAIKGLVGLIMNWRDSYSSGTLKLVTGALANLATDHKCGIEIAAVGGINALDTIIRYCRNVSVREEAVRVFSNLLEVDTNREHVALAGSVESLVALAKTWLYDYPILQVKVVGDLWALSATSEVNSTAIGRQEGISALVRLAVRSQREDVQSMVAGALWSLAFNPGNAMRIVNEYLGTGFLLRICFTGCKSARFTAALAFAYMFDGRLEEYSREAEGGLRTTEFIKTNMISILKDIELILKNHFDLHVFTGVSLSSAAAQLAQVAESVRIVEVGQLQCKQPQIERFVSMLRHKSPVLKSWAAFALFQFTVPGGRYAHHHVNLLEELGASRVLRVTAAATACPLEVRLFAKLVLRNMEHQQTSSA